MSLIAFKCLTAIKPAAPKQGKILHFYAFLLDKPQKYVKADEQRL